MKGKKVISGFGAWGVKKKWESTFSPGSPVILKGKASKKNGAPLTACCQMRVTPLMHPLRSDVLLGLLAWEDAMPLQWDRPGWPSCGSPLRLAGHWELDTATTEFLEPGSKKAEPADGPEPVYAQR